MKIKQFVIISLFVAVGNIVFYLFILPKSDLTNETSKEKEFVYISGKVTDFNNNPIEKVTVGIKNQILKIFIKRKLIKTATTR